MKKKKIRGYLSQRIVFRKFILMLRLCIFLTVVLSLSASGSALSQRVSVEFKDVGLRQVFKELRQQTGLFFLFNEEQLDKNVRVSFSGDDMDVKKVLDSILKDLPYSYEIVTDKVVIVPLYEKSKENKHLRITGRVVDDSKEPLPGVTIILKGTSVGTVTDKDGYFSLNIPVDENTVLLFSFIGMETKELKLKTEVSDYLVVMEFSSTDLDEVIATGYFNMTRESFTGAARTFTAEEIQRGGNQNILTSLQNLDPSFIRIEDNLSGSNPNVIPDYKIRGSGSITGLRDEYIDNPNVPVFIVDGFETTAARVFDMDNNRVSSITILKDAAATAIYGSRASNGVVVITTATPKAGRLSLTYNIDASFYIADLSDYNLTNAREKLEIEKVAGMYNGSHISYQVPLDVAYGEKMENILRGYDTYWLDKPLDAVSVGTKHTLRLEGGSESVRYSLDLNYNNTPGVMKRSGRIRTGVLMSLQYVHKKVTFKNVMEYADVRAKNSPYGVFREYAKMNPYVRYKDDNGDYLYIVDRDNRFTGSSEHFENITNPLYNSRIGMRDEEKYTDFTDRFSIDWTILDELRLKGNFSFTKQNSSRDVFKPAEHTDFSKYADGDFYRKGSYNAMRGESFSYDGNVVLSYFLRADKHVLNSNLGWNIQEIKTKEFTVEAVGFPNEKLDYISFGSSYAYGSPDGDEYTSRLVGFFGAANYSYDERFLADLSMRMDASSRYGSNKKWAPFWSAGIGWNLHREGFMKGWNVFNRFKINASYGMTGSQNFNPYQALSTYKYLSNERYFDSIGVEVMALGNENLKWQKSFKQNYGFDIDTWKNRVNVRMNYFIETTKHALLDVTLPPSLGFKNYKENLGEIELKGYEFQIRVNLLENRQRRLNWSVSFEGIHSVEKLKKISNALSAYNEAEDKYLDAGREDPNKEKLNKPRVRFIEGQSMNTIWVNKSLGIDPATGNELFLAKDGSIVKDWKSENYVAGGCTDPDLKGTFSTRFGYRGFEFNLYFQYSFGGDLYNQTLIDKVQDADLRYNVDKRVYEKRWRNPGDQVMFTNFGSGGGNSNMGHRTKPTSRFVEKNNYLELATMNVSYYFASSLVKSMGLSKLKATFYMNDVFRSSTIKRERGIDYPFARNFSVGVSASF